MGAEQEENTGKKSGVFSYLFCGKLKEVVSYSSKIHRSSGGRYKGPQTDIMKYMREKEDKETLKKKHRINTHTNFANPRGLLRSALDPHNSRPRLPPRPQPSQITT